MLDIVLVVAVFSTLLVVVALSQPLAARLRLAPVVLLAVIGVSVSAASGVLLRMPLPHWFGWLERVLADLPLGSETFIYVFLPLLVFEAALGSDVRRIFEDAAPILVLAVIKTLAAAGIVGVALWPFAGLSLAACLLLGAVVSTTDTGAVIAIFRDVGAPARLTRLVEGEALLNDAAAIVLYTVLIDVIVSGRQLDIWGGRFRVHRLLSGRRRPGSCRRTHFPPGHSLDSRPPVRRGNTHACARISLLHRGGSSVSCLGRRGRACGGYDR